MLTIRGQADLDRKHHDDKGTIGSRASSEKQTTDPATAMAEAALAASDAASALSLAQSATKQAGSSIVLTLGNAVDRISKAIAAGRGEGESEEVCNIRTSDLLRSEAADGGNDDGLFSYLKSSN